MATTTTKQQASNTAKPAKRINPLIPIIAVIAVIGLVIASFFLYKHLTRQQPVDAKAACFAASSELRIAQNKYSNLRNGDASDLGELTEEDVTDPTTLTYLTALLEEAEPQLVACNVQGDEALNEATTRITSNKAWYEEHRQYLQEAVDAVLASKK